MKNNEFMTIDELKRIAGENDYEFSSSFGDFHFTKRDSNNFISVSGPEENRLWTSIEIYCDDKDFDMLKAAVKFAETPLDEREEEKKYYLVKFSEKEIEEIKEKYNMDLSDFEMVEVEEDRPYDHLFDMYVDEREDYDQGDKLNI